MRWHPSAFVVLTVALVALANLTLAQHTAQTRVITNSIGMKLVLIPAGEFLMGAPEGENNRWRDETQHKVTLTQAFWMGKYEVTQEQYQQVMGKNPSWFSAKGGGREQVAGLDTRRFPVDQVSWEDAVEFCRRLSQRAPEQAAKWVYELPTEAQWEYACRGGSRTYQVFHLGNSLSSHQANFLGGFPYGNAPKGPSLDRTTTVGSYKENAFGLHDMHGNVEEWCADWYDKEVGNNGPRKDPTGPREGMFRVVRGGSWQALGFYCRSAARAQDDPIDYPNRYGFRVVARKES